MREGSPAKKYLPGGPLGLTPAPLPVGEVGFPGLLVGQPPLRPVTGHGLLEPGGGGRRGLGAVHCCPGAERRHLGPSAAGAHRAGAVRWLTVAAVVVVAVVFMGYFVDSIALLEGQAEIEPPAFS